MAEKHQDDTLNAEVERTPKADQEKNERSEVYNANFESQVLPSMTDDSNSSSDTEHETSAGDILNYHAKGCWGRIERIPLNVKLLMVSLVSVLGLLIFGTWLIVSSSSALSKASIASKYQQLMEPLQSMVTSLGVERAASMSWVTNPSTSALSSMSDARTYSDIGLDKLLPFITLLQKEDSLDQLTRNFVDSTAKLQQQLIDFRASISATPNYAAVLTFFATAIESLLVVEQRMCSLVASNMGQCFFHSYLLRMNEQTGISRASGVVLTNLGNSATAFERKEFLNSLQLESLYYSLLLSSAESNQQGMLNNAFSAPEITHLDAIRANYTTWLAGLSPKPNITDTELISAVTTRINWIVSQIAVPVERYLLNSNTSALTTAIALMISVILSCIGCFLLSCCITFGFSKTITGPWQRMLEVQQKVMHMFVPQSMLSMMKIKQVSQLSYGHNVGRKVTVVTSILNQQQTCSHESGISPVEQLEFFNNFLSSVGSIIRTNGGYIHKHLDTEGFVAVFTSNSEAIRATIAIHEITEMVLNKQNNNFPAITLHSGLCHGDAVIGTIGESQRMDIALIAECSKVSKLLAHMNKRYHSHILTTKDSISGVKMKKLSGSRLLTLIKHCSKEIYVYELFNVTRLEMHQTRDQFNNATCAFFHHKFNEARMMYEDILQTAPHDPVIKQRVTECNKMILFNTNYKSKMDRSVLNIHNTLSSPVLLEAFEQYTKKEQSHENIRLWNAIQSYRVAPKSKRHSLAKNLYQDFLDESSSSLVNINDKHRFAVKTALEQSTSERQSIFSKVVGAMNDNLLDELSAVIEFNMLDTFERFKATNEMKDALTHREIVQETLKL